MILKAESQTHTHLTAFSSCRATVAPTLALSEVTGQYHT